MRCIARQQSPHPYHCDCHAWVSRQDARGFHPGDADHVSFFASIGCSTNAAVFLQSALMPLFFGVTILFIHLAFVLLCKKIYKIDLAEMIVASAAALVGSASAAAIARPRIWPTLTMPGIMCGILGYAIATFVSLYIASVLSN